jgi:hypothetical protein
MLTHSGLKPQQCQYCDRAYALKGDLTKHMRKAHLDSKAFRLVVELREHQREHMMVPQE